MNNYEKLIQNEIKLNSVLNTNLEKTKIYLIDNLMTSAINKIRDFLPEFGYRIPPFGIKEFTPGVEKSSFNGFSYIPDVQQLAESLFSLAYLDKALWMQFDSFPEHMNLVETFINKDNEILSKLSNTSTPDKYNLKLYELFKNIDFNYISASNWFNQTIDDMESTISELTQGHGILINRLGRYNLDSIKDYYSEHAPIIIRLSANLYYNATYNKWMLINKLKLNTGWADGELFTKASAKWFISNYRSLFKDLFEDKDDEVYQQAEELLPEIFKNLKDIDLEIRKYANRLLEIDYSIANNDRNTISDEEKYNFLTLLNMCYDKVNDYIIFINKVIKENLSEINTDGCYQEYLSNKESLMLSNNELNLKYKNLYKDYLLKLEQYYLFKTDDKEQVEPEITKAMRLLDKFKSKGIINLALWNSESKTLEILTNPLVMDYVDLDNVSKAYLNSSLECNNGTYESKYRQHLIKKMLDGDTNLAFVTNPLIIVIEFYPQNLHVTFSVDDTEAKFLCENCHLRYGNCDSYFSNIKNKTINTNTGCQGSFRSTIQEAERQKELTKLISYAIQYVKTFVPLDPAGNGSLSNALIVDLKTGAILSAIHNKRLEGFNYNKVMDAYGNLFLNGVEDSQLVKESDYYEDKENFYKSLRGETEEESNNNEPVNPITEDLDF